MTEAEKKLWDCIKRYVDFTAEKLAADKSTNIESISFNSDFSAVFKLVDGRTFTSPPLRGEALPKVDGTASAGTSECFSREDHVHPHDDAKVDTVAGKGLSEKDFTAELKEKLDGIAKHADVTNDQITQGTVDAYLALGMES